MTLRPAESEHWPRIAALCPRLRTDVSVTRTVFRGEPWYVLADPLSGRHYRVTEGAYRFLALLDGQTEVNAAADRCRSLDPDISPTQDEVLQLLASLHGDGLLSGDVPADAFASFRRRRKRIVGEHRSRLLNFLFIRIPLIDPDPLLDALLPLTGWIFTRAGALIWSLLILVGLVTVAMNIGKLAAEAAALVDVGAIPLILATFIAIKVCHEFGHGIACKRLCSTIDTNGGRSGGEVHRMGIMLLVLMPIPFVDASSAWRSASRLNRVVVGAAGMWIELGLASVASLIWVKTSETSPVHAAAYSAMIVAGVSTLLFNLNPLLRFDGYYILSDALEIPNLSQRSREYMQYLVKRYVWGLSRAISPARSAEERRAFMMYGPLALLYRGLLYGSILLLVASRVPLIGVLLALMALVGWGVVPLWRLLTRIAGSPELDRVRVRAALTTAGMAGIPFLLIALVPLPDRVTIEGVVVSPSRIESRAPFDGFVAEAAGPTQIGTDSGLLLALETNELALRRDMLEQRQEVARTQYLESLQTDPALAAQYLERSETIAASAEWTLARLEEAEVDGQAGHFWTPRPALAGRYVRRGEVLGTTLPPSDVMVHAVAGQNVAPSLMQEADSTVILIVRGAPQRNIRGTVEQFAPIGTDQLPSAALSRPAGGQTVIGSEDRTAEQIFQVHIRPIETDLKPGQRVLVRFSRPARSAGSQFIRWTRQTLRQRGVL